MKDFIDHEFSMHFSEGSEIYTWQDVLDKLPVKLSPDQIQLEIYNCQGTAHLKVFWIEKAKPFAEEIL